MSLHALTRYAPLRTLMTALVGFMALIALSGGARAADNNIFVIDDTEGYGITECLVDGKSCGRVVADAWCEAHGLGPALAFGRAEDMTASIAPSKAAAKSEALKDKAAKSSVNNLSERSGSVIVHCDK